MMHAKRNLGAGDAPSTQVVVIARAKQYQIGNIKLGDVSAKQRPVMHLQSSVKKIGRHQR